MKNICIVCNQEFEAERKTKKYCSKKCKKLHLASLKKKLKEETNQIACKNCGVLFCPPRERSVCCCKQCYKDLKKEIKSTRICDVCGREFTPARDNQLRCSKKCKKSYNDFYPTEIPCLVCNKMFTPVRKKQKCCCNECTVFYRSKTKGGIKKICTICSAEFITIRINQERCSKECNKVHQKEYIRKRADFNPIETPCIVCGNLFLPVRKKHVCCSEPCKRKLEYKNLPVFKKICPVCNSEFETNNKNTTYCSVGCVNTACKKHDDVTVNCEECGIEFVVPYIYRDRRFCTNVCVAKNMNKNHPEIAEKQSITMKKLYASGELVHPWVGRHHSEETKEKLKISRTGKSCGVDNYMYGKRGEECPNYGVKRTAEQKENYSKSKTKQWLDGKYNGVEFNSLYKKGYYFSSKLNRNIYHRSGYEKTVFEILDKDPKVLTFLSEPFSLKYFYDHGRNYIPDLLITYCTGEQKLVEIKPKYLTTDEKNLAKFAAAREYCVTHNMVFEVWTEDTIKELLKE